MRMTIEQFLKGEAQAAGIACPMVIRQHDGSIKLYEAPATVAAASDIRHIATFSGVMDALARVGAVAAAYAQNKSDEPNERQQKDATISDGRA